MKRFFCALLAFFTLMTCTASASTDSPNPNPTFVNANFLTSAKLDKEVNPEDGSTVYTLKKTETMAQNFSASEAYHKMDSLVLVADNAAAAKEIEEYLASVKLNSSNYREGYYLGSSVYMYSTVYFSTRNAGFDFPAMKITSIKAGLTVSNGTLLQGWTMRVSQAGTAADGSGLFMGNQVQEYNLYGGSNPRTITPPSSWKEIIMEPTGLSNSGANTYGTARRPGGSSQTYILENHIF